MMTKLTYFLLFVMTLTVDACLAFEEKAIKRPRFCVFVTSSSFEDGKVGYWGLLVRQKAKNYLLQASRNASEVGRLVYESKDNVVELSPLKFVIDKNTKRSLVDFPLVAYELNAETSLLDRLSFVSLDENEIGLDDQSFACGILDIEALNPRGLPFVNIPIHSWAIVAKNEIFGFGEGCHVINALPLEMYSPIVKVVNGECKLAGITFSTLESNEKKVAGQIVLHPNTISRLLSESNVRK